MSTSQIQYNYYIGMLRSSSVASLAAFPSEHGSLNLLSDLAPRFIPTGSHETLQSEKSKRRHAHSALSNWAFYRTLQIIPRRLIWVLIEVIVNSVSCQGWVFFVKLVETWPSVRSGCVWSALVAGRWALVSCQGFPKSIKVVPYSTDF